MIENLSLALISQTAIHHDESMLSESYLWLRLLFGNLWSILLILWSLTTLCANEFRILSKQNAKIFFQVEQDNFQKLTLQ